jgi:hypothetical protein
MPQERVKNTAITSVGFDYQTLHGLQLLCEWLAAPTRYKCMRFECTDKEVAPQSLDDIVAVRSDGRSDYWQVKYTPNPADNPFTWDWLLDVGGKTARARSNLRKWFDALKKIDDTVIGNAQLVTNKIPDRDIEVCLAGGDKLDLVRAPEEVQRRVEAALGSRENADWLFSRLHIVHSDKGYLNLNNSVVSVLLRHTDSAGVDRLKNRVREWAFFEQEPHPDGWITLDIVRSVISQIRPQPIPEDFTIPEGYQVPDEAFHQAFMAEVETVADSIMVLSGPPGRGKSTYLSHLCEVLQAKNIPIIRHHYFLSLADRTIDRLSSYIVRDSLLGQIDRFHSRAGAKTEGDADLHTALAACAAFYKTQQMPFVVVIDGLDHVWRENATDKKPLDDLFTQLIPVADNMVLIVGTQPVADTQLPDRLLMHVSRLTWKLLPAMSAMSVMNYMRAQVTCGRLLMRHDGHLEEQLAESAHEMHQITGGHPLHVIYATEHLINSGDDLSKWSVEQIPGNLSKDANTYYESLWLKLTFVQRDVLILLAKFRFYWPAEAFYIPTLLPGYDGHLNLREVEHLLHSTAAGLQPFHESLVVFINARADFTERVQVLAPRVEHWLEKEATAHLKNTWLWSVQAQLGSPNNLIQGLTRDWVIDRLATGYSVDVPIDLLAEAEVSAFDRRRYADAYRLRHLKTRLLNGPEFQIPDATRLKVCSWKCADDGAVLNEAFASRHQLPVVDLAGLGVALWWRGLDQEATECGKDALRRHRGDSRFAVERRDSNQLEEVLYLGKVFAELDTLQINDISPRSALNVGDLRLAAAFISGLMAKQDLTRLMALREKLPRPSRRKLVEDATIRVAAVTTAKIHSWAEFKTFRHSSIAGCWAQLVDEPHDMLPFSPLPMNWNDFSDSEPLARLTHEWFFKSILVKLTARGEFTWIQHPTSQADYRSEVVSYLNRMTLYAEVVAEKWSKKIPVAFHEFYDFFADLQPPGKHEADKRYPHAEFCKTLIQVALDCQMLGAALGAPALVDAASLELATRSPWFNLHHFREAYTQIGIRLLTDDAARFIIGHGRAYLSQWAETCEYARTVLELCEVALMHEMEGESRQLCRLCWDYVLGYGHRKDPAILTLLEAIEHLADDAPDLCRVTLKEIAPQVHHITDYTDGSGTRHAHNYADELLVKLDRISLAEKYACHISSGDWHYADESFASFFSGDLSSAVFESLARTGLPEEALSNLRKQAEQGEPIATKLLEIAASHNGVAYGTLKEPSDRDNASEFKEFEGKPEEYPPDLFDSLLSAIKESKTYGIYVYLPKWYGYWAARERESDLLRVLEPRLLSEEGRRDDCHYMLDQAFESSLKLYGKDKAFRYAVQAQKEMGGWSDFYESAEKSKQRLHRVAELYPQRADEFIAASCFSWLRHKHQPSSRVIPSDKLVFFLVELGRFAEANDLVRAMVRSVQDDTRNLPLTTPPWAVDFVNDEDANAEVRFLVARSRWPVPAVKWWALQELADLLTQPHTVQIEAELYRALALSKLETEVVELLFVFWLAKQAGYIPNVTLTTYINSRSPASSMVLGDLFSPLLHEGNWRSPLILAPITFKVSADFEEAQGTTVPRIFLTLLKKLEHPQFPLFVKQYAFEWENTDSLYPEAPLQRYVGYFFRHPIDEMTGQFVTRASHRGRSAYLRTLEISGAQQSLVEQYTQVALPLDPTFAALRPSQPNWLQAWDPHIQPEVPTIDEYLRHTAQQLIKLEPGMLLLALSLPLHISEKCVIDLEVVRWVQWEVRSVDAVELLDRFERSSAKRGFGWCDADELSKNTVCPITPLSEFIDTEICAAPTAGEFGRWRRGYLHADIDSRGLVLPISTVKDAQVIVQPKDGELELAVGTSRIGRWKYWNTGWDSSHPRLTRAFCGTALTAEATQLRLFWENVPLRHFYLWRCTTLLRDESFSKYSSQQICGVTFELS